MKIGSAPARQVVEEEDVEREPAAVASAPAPEDDALSYFQQLAEE